MRLRPLMAVGLFLLASCPILASKRIPSVAFEENSGQWPASVNYVVSGLSYHAFLTSDGLRLFPASSRGIELRWIRSKPAQTLARDPLPYHANYFLREDADDWKTSVRYFESVVYDNVYPGISVVYHGHGNMLEQDIHVRPGADSTHLRFEVKGASRALVDSSGTLILKAGDDVFTFAAPTVYQAKKNGGRVRVSARYVVDGSTVSFRIAKYDRTAELVIDPVLSYSTYLPKINFVTNSNGTILSSGSDAFLSANSTGAACVTDHFALYGYDANGNVTFTVPDTRSVPPQIVGGTVFEDGQGNCFVAGVRSFTNGGGQSLAAVAKFSSTGSLLYVSYFGGNVAVSNSLGAVATQVAADSSGNAYLVGSTTFADFPLKNPIQNLLKGSSDAFVLKLDPSGSNLVYSTYFGTDIQFPSQSIAVDGQGNAYIAGSTGLSTSSIPVTNGVLQGSPKGVNTAWVAKLDMAGSETYGTYLGGSQSDGATGVAADANGNAYVVGNTCSSDFPLKNAFQATIAATSCAGGGNVQDSGFLSKLAPDGSGLVYSTFFGGADALKLQALALDSSGAAYIGGSVSGANFPLVTPVQADFLDSVPVPSTGTVMQGFVTAFNSSGSALQYSTLLGGFNPDLVNTINVDSAQNIYIGGSIQGARTQMGNPPFLRGFPIVSANNGLLQPFFPFCPPTLGNCGDEGFIAKISPGAGTVLASDTAVDFGTVIKGSSSPAVPLVVANVGSADLQVGSVVITGDYSISNNTCSGALLSAKHCEIDVVFSPTTGGTRTGTITVPSTAPDSPRNIQLTGIGGVPIVSLSATSLSLTSPAIGTAGPSQTITVNNIGADVLNISALAIVGPNAADFSESHDCATTLAAGAACHINVSYKASASSNESATVQLSDNASGSPHTVNLSGIISALGLALGPGMPSSLTVSAGQAATFNLVVGGPGFSGNASLHCSGAPAGSDCTAPGSVSLGSKPTPFQVTVTTTARSAVMAVPSLKIGFPAVVLTMFFVGLLGSLMIANNRRKILVWVGACLCLMAMVSCGGSSGGPKSTGTPAGTYTLTVTANEGSATQSLNLTLNVN